MLSTATVSRSRKRPSGSAAAGLEQRRARTRLLLGPALAALRLYRKQVVEHCDETIARFEALAAWCNGGKLPTWAAEIAEVLPIVDEGKEETRRHCNAMERLMTERSTVVFCEIACHVFARLAALPGGAGLREHAAMLASRLHDSSPSHSNMPDVEALFTQQLKDGGIPTGLRDFYGMTTAEARS